MSESRSQLDRSRQIVTTTSEERTWAAMAHASTLFTLVVGLPTAGLSGLLFVFIPLLIYMAYRDKSRYVAFHAAQAFALQVVATVGWFISLVAGIIVFVVLLGVSGVLSIILIGLLLIPIIVLIGIVYFMIWVAAPFAIGGFAVYAAIETGNSRDYRYPYIGRLVENWLVENEQTPTPAV